MYYLSVVFKAAESQTNHLKKSVGFKWAKCSYSIESKWVKSTWPTSVDSVKNKVQKMGVFAQLTIPFKH